MKVLFDFYVIALILLQIRQVYSEACFDNKTYAYGDDETQNCNWLRNQDDREELCVEEEVFLNCPVSCAVCCEDDPTYTFLSLKKVKEFNCESLDKKVKKEKYCNLFRNGQMVRNGCPKACSHCIKAVTNTPTQSTIVCEDNANYIYGEKVNHTCQWVRNKRREDLCLISEVALNCPFSCGHCCDDDPRYRIVQEGKKEKKCRWLNTADKLSIWCNTYNNRQMVRKGCPKSCNNCPSKVTSMPSTLPSSSPPTKLATDIPTDKPTKAPSLPPTKKPTNAPILLPTKMPTNAPIIPPTKKPDKTKKPVAAPTKKPVGKPTKRPSNRTKSPVTPSPTTSPVTPSPTTSPTSSPTNSPTSSPTESPTDSPTDSPTNSPTSSPTDSPTNSPTSSPTESPTDSPTDSPTTSPTSSPTSSPTWTPLFPTADSHIYCCSSKNSNFGTDEVIQVKNDPNFGREGLLRFDLTEYKKKAVKSATLRLSVKEVLSGGLAVKKVTVYKIQKNAWTENVVTYSNLNAVIDHTGPTVKFAKADEDTYVSFDIIDLYVKALIAGDDELSLMLKVTSTAGGKAFVGFFSKESSTPPMIVFEASDMNYY